jgi:hypothetical protein
MTTDILLVSVNSTSGWRTSTNELAESLSRAGATVARVTTGRLRRVRTFALTDFGEAYAARRACEKAIARHDPEAVIYCSITTALLWPRPGAIWIDSLAAENRPGRHGIWQRPTERRRVAQASLTLGMSARSLTPIGMEPDFLVPVPVGPSGPPAARRDIDAITYAGNPEKRRLHYVLEAWSEVRRDNETLLVAGTDGTNRVDGVEPAGRLAPAEYRKLLRRARVFVAAPRREDYGIAPLEALADGCLLVTTPAPGPYPALDLARKLDPRLVGDDLTIPLRTALDDPVPDYAERARELLEPFSSQAVDQTLSQHVLPRLVSRFKGSA